MVREEVKPVVDKKISCLDLFSQRMNFRVYENVLYIPGRNMYIWIGQTVVGGRRVVRSENGPCGRRERGVLILFCVKTVLKIGCVYDKRKTETTKLR